MTHTDPRLFTFPKYAVHTAENDFSPSTSCDAAKMIPKLWQSESRHDRQPASTAVRRRNGDSTKPRSRLGKFSFRNSSSNHSPGRGHGDESRVTGTRGLIRCLPFSNRWQIGLPTTHRAIPALKRFPDGRIVETADTSPPCGTFLPATDNVTVPSVQCLDRSSPAIVDFDGPFFQIPPSAVPKVWCGLVFCDTGGRRCFLFSFWEPWTCQLLDRESVGDSL